MSGGGRTIFTSADWRFGLLITLGAIILGSTPATSAGPPNKEPAKEKQTAIEVLFSPDGGCQERIITEVAKAKKRVRVQMYIFNSKPIADAIIAAHKRGVDCEIISDKSEETKVYGRLPVLKRAGVTVLLDGEHEVANNKIMLIDDHTIITGSYNYTKAAEEKNAENLLIIKNCPEVFADYSANYEAHKAHSRAHQRS